MSGPLPHSAPPHLAQKWAVLAFVCCANAFNYMDRMLVSVMSDPIRREFGLSDTQLGLLTGAAFAFLYAAASLPAGRLADTRSRRNLLAGSLAMWSVFTAATGFARSFWQLVIARMAIAGSEAGCTPSVYSLLAEYFTPRERNMTGGLFVGCSMLGLVGGFAIGGWLSQSYGWRTAFFLLGLPGLLLALTILLVIKEPPRGTFDTRTDEPAPSLLAAIGGLLKNRPFVLLLLAIGANSTGVFAVTQWVPQFLIRDHGLSVARMGLLFGVAFGVGMFAGNIVGGSIGSRQGKRSIATPLWLSVVTSIAIIPVYLFSLLTGSTSAAIWGLAIAAALGAAGNPPSTAAAQNFVSPRTRGAAGSLTMITVAIFGMGLGPVVVGALSDLLAPAYGEERLRVALMIIQVANIVAALFYGLAARSWHRANNGGAPQTA